MNLAWERRRPAGVFRVEPVVTPAPPQTRTSRFPAYGSSSGRKATVTTSAGSVDEAYRLCVLASFPRRCFHQAVPFPTPRLPRFGSPAFHWYYETAKTPARISGHSVRHVAPNTLVGFAHSLLAAREARCDQARMFFDRFILPGIWYQGRVRVSQVPREPHYTFALLSDPGRTSAPCLFAALRCCPRELHNEGSSNKYPFETQSHGFGIRCLRFVPPFRVTTQDSLPGVANLFRVGLATH